MTPEQALKHLQANRSLKDAMDFLRQKNWADLNYWLDCQILRDFYDLNTKGVKETNTKQIKASAHKHVSLLIDVLMALGHFDDLTLLTKHNFSSVWDKGWHPQFWGDYPLILHATLPLRPSLMHSNMLKEEGVTLNTVMRAEIWALIHEKLAARWNQMDPSDVILLACPNEDDFQMDRASFQSGTVMIETDDQSAQINRKNDEFFYLHGGRKQDVLAILKKIFAQSGSDCLTTSIQTPGVFERQIVAAIHLFGLPNGALVVYHTHHVNSQGETIRVGDKVRVFWDMEQASRMIINLAKDREAVTRWHRFWGEFERKNKPNMGGVEQVAREVEKLPPKKSSI